MSNTQGNPAGHGDSMRRALSGLTTDTGDAVWLEVGATASKRTIPGILVSGSFGVLGLVSAATGGVWGGTGATIAVVIVSSLFLALAVLCVLGWRVISRPCRLGFDVRGITWEDPRGNPWAVRWEELAGVSLSRTDRKFALSPEIVRNVVIRLDLVPVDESFRNRHPEMERLWEFHRMRNGYRMPLGQSPNFIPAIDDAMRRFRPEIYGGIRDEGFAPGVF